MRSANSRAGSGAALVADARIGRHEGGIEGAFGKDGAKMIGQPERDEERVGDRAGAEDRRQHDVAHKAGDARQQRQAADGKNAADHRLSDTSRLVGSTNAVPGVQQRLRHAQSTGLDLHAKSAIGADQAARAPAATPR